MAMFVHFAADRDLAAIRRRGLRPGRWARGIYAVPATTDFFASHQWLRELRRGHRGRTLLAVYFRVQGDHEAVFGPYGGPHVVGTADMAVGALMTADEPLGFETILPGVIDPRQITGVAKINGATGWRYYPKAKGRVPCTCPMCLRKGEPFSRRLREKFPVG